MTPRGWIYLALVVLVLLGLWRGGAALYDAGVTAERLRHEAAAAEAARKDRAAEQKNTTTSESVADSTREEAATVQAETRTETATSIGKINDAYAGRPLPCPVGPIAVLPDGVREELEAGHAALTAASRRLPPGADAGPKPAADMRAGDVPRQLGVGLPRVARRVDRGAPIARPRTHVRRPVESRRHHPVGSATTFPGS